MARRIRIGPKDVTQHVVQRGNNRKICFTCEQDNAYSDENELLERVFSVQANLKK